MGPGYAAYKLAMELSPILLTNGIATSMAGGVLPIIAFTEAAHFTLGLLSGAENIELDDFVAHFEPIPGSTLIDNLVASYPFANQAVAEYMSLSDPRTDDDGEYAGRSGSRSPNFGRAVKFTI